MEVKPGYKQTEVGVIPADWEVKPVSEGITLLSGHHVLARHCNTDGDGIPYITGPADFPKGVIQHTKYTTSPKTICRANDILVTVKGSGAGTIVLSDAEYCISRQLMATRVNENWDTSYIYFSLLQSASLFNTAATGLIPGLSRSDILDKTLPLPPSLAEQTVIATALSDADALIQSLERLIAKKRDIKQGAMQELLTGKKRLPGFEEMKGYKQTEVGTIPEDWGIIKLNNIVSNFVNGGTPSTKNKDYWNGNIPWITGADIINQCVGEIRRHITKDAVRNSSTNVIQKGNLLIVSRTGVGKLATTPFDIAISQDFTGIYMDDSQASTEYIYRFFDYHQSLLKKEIQGTSIKGITRDTLAEIQIPVPTLAEQSAIATALSDMDAEITALDSKLTKASQIKQGMMQELLTGRIRLT